jgi:hypothetical protein
VVWTHVAYLESGEDAGVWGTRTDTPDSLQNIKYGSERAEFDDRLEIDKGDVVYTKRMPSAFFETPLQSLLVWHQVDTVILTGGSTSGCIRATAVDSLSRGYRTIVPEECVADKHESYHYANLTDLHLKYADVLSVAEVLAWLETAGRPGLSGEEVEMKGDPDAYDYWPYENRPRRSAGPTGRGSPSGWPPTSSSTSSIRRPTRNASRGPQPQPGRCPATASATTATGSGTSGRWRCSTSTASAARSRCRALCEHHPEIIAMCRSATGSSSATASTTPATPTA